MKRFAEELAENAVVILAGNARLEGSLVVPQDVHSIILFVHGSGSSRHSLRNRYVAGALQEGGLATLLFDLLSEEEESIDIQTTHLRFDVAFLAERLLHAIDWVRQNDATSRLKIGLFGSSTGAGAALLGAAMKPNLIGAAVSRGGRPDLAGSALENVKAPTLLIVGGSDTSVITPFIDTKFFRFAWGDVNDGERIIECGRDQSRRGLGQEAVGADDRIRRCGGRSGKRCAEDAAQPRSR